MGVLGWWKEFHAHWGLSYSSMTLFRRMEPHLPKASPLGTMSFRPQPKALQVPSFQLHLGRVFKPPKVSPTEVSIPHTYAEHAALHTRDQVTLSLLEYLCPLPLSSLVEPVLLGSAQESVLPWAGGRGPWCITNSNRSS